MFRRLGGHAESIGPDASSNSTKASESLHGRLGRGVVSIIAVVIFEVLGWLCLRWLWVHWPLSSSSTGVTYVWFAFILIPQMLIGMCCGVILIVLDIMHTMYPTSEETLI